MIPCPHQPPTRGDNIVLVAQGDTATPGATKQLSPLDLSCLVYTHTYLYISYLFQIDNALLFMDLGGMSELVKLLNSTDPDLRHDTAFVLGSAMQRSVD